MERLLQYLSLLLVLLSWLACKEQAIPDTVNKTAAEQVAQLEQVPPAPANADSLLSVWKRLDEHPVIKQDTALSAIVKYNIGRLYAMTGNDTAQFYVEQALELIDPTQGNLEEKAQIYTGMGNIWNSKAKRHQANYYYNKAATIVLSDSSLDLSPQSKTIMLLSAAQSNGSLYQFNLAQQMNKAALSLVPLLPPKHINRQRPLVQTIQMMNALQEPADSIKVYLGKMEALHKEYPDDYDISFLYECKSKYFERTGEEDSLLHYQILKSKVDEERYLQKPSSQTRIDNLFVSYTNIAGTYILLGKEGPAAAKLQQAEALRTKHPDLITWDNLILYKNNLAILNEKQGKSREALNLMFEVYELQKNNYRTENIQAVAEMNSLYQLQSKDRSIRSLNEDIKINHLQLQQNRLWLLVSILAAILLSLTLLFLYYSYRQRRARQEKEKVLMQQQLLRTQMEPHFIFNTLSAVQSFVRLDQKEKAIKYLNRFSKLLRSSLELSREKLVPLDEEIETLENYLSLQQMRFENAFSYRIEQPDEQDFGAVMLPPMLLQPYVENAILHGMDFDSGEGNIDIGFRIDGLLLTVTITDSGKAQAGSAKPAHRSLSGAISRERMHLLGKKANVNISSHSGGGTTVTLHIPVLYG